MAPVHPHPGILQGLQKAQMGIAESRPAAQCHTQLHASGIQRLHRQRVVRLGNRLYGFRHLRPQMHTQHYRRNYKNYTFHLVGY